MLLAAILLAPLDTVVPIREPSAARRPPSQNTSRNPFRRGTHLHEARRAHTLRTIKETGWSVG